MAIRKKGCRHIVVDGIKYRWVAKYNGCINRDSICCPEWNTLLIEQVGSKNGQILRATFGMYRRYVKSMNSEDVFVQQLSITPHIVKQVIQVALTQYDWQPTQKKKLLNLPNPDLLIDLEDSINYNGLEDYKAKVR